MERKYAVVNGVRMYYELYGESGMPLVLIHGVESTIWRTFGRLLPLLSRSPRIIAVSLQRDADDVAGLLSYLGVSRANVLGHGTGGSMALRMAIRYPELVNRLIVISPDQGRDDFCDDELRSIRARALILSSVRDVITPGEAVRLSRLIPGSRPVILPGGSGEVIGTMESGSGDGFADAVAWLVNNFLGPALEVSVLSSALRVDKSPVHPFDAQLQ